MGQSWIEPTTGRQWRSWVIARGKLVAASSTVMFKTRVRRFQIAGGSRPVVYSRTTSRATSRGYLRLSVARPVTRLVVRRHDW